MIKQDDPRYSESMQTMSDEMEAAIARHWARIGEWSPAITAGDAFMAVELAAIEAIQAKCKVNGRQALALVDDGATRWLKQRADVLALCQGKTESKH